MFFRIQKYVYFEVSLFNNILFNDYLYEEIL